MNDRNRNFRPKPEPEPKSFRFGSGSVILTETGMGILLHIVLQRSAQSILTLIVRLKKLVLVLYSTKTYYTECFHDTAEKIFPIFIENTLQTLKFLKYLL